MTERTPEGRPVADDETRPATESLPGTEIDLTSSTDVVTGPQVLADGTSNEPIVLSRRAGMWGDGSTSADTSGYGSMQHIIEWPGTATPPFGGWYDLVASRLAGLVPGFADRVLIHRDEITFVLDRTKLPEVARWLRDDQELRFEVCSSVSGVHYPNQIGAELHAVYHVLSITHNRRIRLEVTCPDADPHIPSIVDTYPMTNYHERETWDMFGIIFDGHPALTRILMPDDWIGHPQRKDYPLGGIPIEYKGATVPPPEQRRSYQS